MPYIPTTPEDQKAMLAAIGARSIEELFAMVPAEFRLDRDLMLPSAVGEMELTAELTELANRNTSSGSAVSFLGGGSYDHFIPAVVDFVASRSEFYTAYTPYQAEASQGTLQAMFEYQTLIAELTGMDVSNASLYDGGSAAAEAVLMAMAATGRSGRVIVPESVHPEYRQVLATYLANLDTELLTVATPGGTASPDDLAAAVNGQTACVLVQHPNFFGCLEEVAEVAEIAHAAGALLIVAVDPISLGLLRRPGEYGADIVVAEGQSLGCPMSFGGPYLGIMACGEPFLRRMPGRLVGQTVDRRGRRCWVLTMQTREQHIRREKATSNICTNQALLALRATVYLAAMGPGGMRSVAELCLQKAAYAREKLASLVSFEITVPAGTFRPPNSRQELASRAPFEIAFDRPTFKEFVVRTKNAPVEKILQTAAREGIFAGVPLGRWYPDLADCFLVAVTEKRTKAEIDRLVDAVARTEAI